MQVARIEEGEAYHLGELAGVRRRDQPAGRRRIQPRALTQLAAAKPHRGQEHRAFEFVWGESGEVGRSEAPGSHARVSRR